MGARVLVVEPVRPMAKAIASVLERHGCRVTLAETAGEACRHPHAFDCGVFSDRLADESGIELAGWLMAEARVRVAVFFAHDDDDNVQLRASNLGTWVQRCLGLNALRIAVLDAITDTELAKAVGAETTSFRMETKTGPRRRRL